MPRNKKNVFSIGDFSFTFSPFAKSDIVIFDQAGSEVLDMCITGNVPHFVLCARRELFYLHPLLFLCFLKNIFRRFNEPFSLGLFYRIYLLSCLEILDPRIVLTFVDNSFVYQWLARFYGKGKFYAIQNGCRLPYNLSKWLPAPPHPASKIYLPNFLCFGNFEKDIYSYYGHDVVSFHPVGSLRGGYYCTVLRSKTVDQRFDICLISEWDYNLKNHPVFPEIEEGIEITYNYLLRYAETRDKKICIAARSQDHREHEYFLNLFGKKAMIIESNREAMSTYRAIDESNVSVAAFSTVGVEAFGWGKKILFCNFTGHSNYNLPVDDMCSIQEKSFESFCNKLDFLLSLNEEKYKTLTRSSAAYLMNYNFAMPAHVYMRKIIRNEVGE